MEKLLESSVIKGIIFSAYDKFGPQPIYTFPRYVSDEEAEQADYKKDKSLKLSLRDYVQISIKNLGLLLGDRASKEEDLSFKEEHFGILPYPDFELTSLSFFHFLHSNISEAPIPSVFAILVDESQRTYLYNNVNRIKPLIIDFFSKFDNVIKNGYPPQEQVEPLFTDLLKKLVEFEKEPFTPIATQRKMKILFAGLDDSGKTSFLLSVNKKYSKLLGLKPTRGASVKSIEALGATIFLWDLGGQTSSRQRYLDKSQIYLFEADLLFYFIDIKNKERFEESFEYLRSILERISQFEQKTPLIFVLSKGDPDVLEKPSISENIDLVISELQSITATSEIEYYITSIFSVFSILRAFSSGISKLSPNKKLINHNLNRYFSDKGVHLSLMLTYEGLVLADYYADNSTLLQDFPGAEIDTEEMVNIRNIFEVTAPQFVMLYKIFSEFRTLEKEEAVFKIAESFILFKKVKISDYNLFFLFLLENEVQKEEISKVLPKFLETTGDLLLRYIS